MAKNAARKSSSSKKKKAKAGTKHSFQPLAWLKRWAMRLGLALIAFFVALVMLYSVVNPPVTHTIWTEWRRLGSVDREWVPMEEIAPVVARSVVAAEDANFCLHWGFDVNAIRAALEDGGSRGASTLSQQVVKNVFLWQGRSWVRKALETGITPLVELVWSKERIIEVYLNVAEMDEGVFGVAAAGRHYFGVDPDQLSGLQAARIAAVLPNPKGRSASNPSVRLRKRTAAIMDGAATIRADGRSACFED